MTKDGRPILLDFGISNLDPEDGAARARAKSATPEHAAPELRGRR